MGLVQSKSTSQASGATLPLTFNSTPSVKNTIIAVGSSTVAADTLAISDGVNSYTALTAIQNAAPSLVTRLFHFINLVTPSSTLTLSGITGASQLAIHEFSGIISFDVAANANGTSTNADSGGATTTKKPDLLFGYAASKFVGSLAAVVANSPFNTAENLIDATNLISILTGWQEVGSTGIFDFTSTISLGKASSVDWASQIAGFLESNVNTSHQQIRMHNA